jgi:hypothetical protein
MATAGAIRAGAAYVELFVKNNVTRGLDAAAAKVRAFAAGISAMGRQLFAVGTGIIASAFGALKVYSDFGSRLLDVASRSGISVEALSALEYAAQQTGASGEDVEKALRHMTTVIIEAARGSANAQLTLARLGITIQQLNGLRPEEQFALFADALAKVENVQVRAMLAMELFGNKVGTKLLPMLANGSQGLKQMQAEAFRLGRIMSTEDAKAAHEFGDALTRLWTAIKMSVVQIGASLAPAALRIADMITNVVVRIREWIEANRNVVIIVAGAAAALTGLGIAFMVLGPAIAAVGMVIKLFSTTITLAATAIKIAAAALTFFISPTGAIVAGILAAGAAFLYFSDVGTKALESTKARFQDLKEVGISAFMGIRDAIAAGDWEGAAEIAWLALKGAWFTGVAWIKSIWRDSITWLKDKWDDLTFGIAEAFNSAVTLIEAAWAAGTAFIGDIWDSIVTNLKVGLNHFVAFVQRVWARVKNIFNKDEAERQIQEINAQLEKANAELRAGQQARSKERWKEEEKAWEEGGKRLLEMQKDHEAKKRERQRENAKAAAEDEAKINEVKEQLKAKQAEMARKARDKADMEMLERHRREMELLEGKNKLRDQFQGLEDLMERLQVVVKGTFSGSEWALRGLGSETIIQQQLQVLKRIEGNTNQLVRLGRQNQPAFQ